MVSIQIHYYMKTKTIDSLILCQSFDFPWNIRPFFNPLRLTVPVECYNLMRSTPDPKAFLVPQLIIPVKDSDRFSGFN